jgi:nucleolar protein 56
MKAFVARSPIGVFAFTESGELLYFQLSEAIPEKAAESMDKPIDNEFLTQLKGYHVVEGSEAHRFMRRHIREYAKDLGFVETDAQYNDFMRNFSIYLSRKRLRGSIGRDKLVIQASNAIEDMKRIESLFLERFYEWYSLHYPEMKNRDYTRIIKYGRRENLPDFTDSVGAEMTDEDVRAVQDFAAAINDIKHKRASLEKYVAAAVREICPNITSLIEPLLAVRLLSMAGSLEKLSRMPASTIQLLGAEKALFRHLHNRGKSPKFGIIFIDPHIQNAPEEKRGKVARILSSKLMLAARIDFYSGRDDSEKLKKELKEEIEKI